MFQETAGVKRLQDPVATRGQSRLSVREAHPTLPRCGGVLPFRLGPGNHWAGLWDLLRWQRGPWRPRTSPLSLAFRLGR